MDRWHLPSIEATGKREPRVLFSTSACRALVIDLQAGEEMGDHQVKENAWVTVLEGRVRIAAQGEAIEATPGMLCRFDQLCIAYDRSISPGFLRELCSAGYDVVVSELCGNSRDPANHGSGLRCGILARSSLS